ncbi:MAG: hypothetical protein AAF478_12075, partial [Pseudomonadota bacterium]
MADRTKKRNSLYTNRLFARHKLAYLQLFAALLVFVILTPLSEASAQNRGRLPLVRDAEIENLIKDYTDPIFRAAGLSRNSVDVYYINRNEFNDFVTVNRMYINTC